jgi:hypothetical protein
LNILKHPQGQTISTKQILENANYPAKPQRDCQHVLLNFLTQSYGCIIMYATKYKGNMMKRTTIMIPEDLKIRAARRANAVGISLGGFIRESLERALNSDGKVALDDPYLSDNSVYEDDIPTDLAQNHDNYLYGD